MFDFLQGIKIYLYDFDHNPPHFHAISAKYEVLISILTLKVLQGEMPKPKLKRILKWAKLNGCLTFFVVGAYSIRPRIKWAYAIRPYTSFSTKTVRAKLNQLALLKEFEFLNPQLRK